MQSHHLISNTSSKKRRIHHVCLIHYLFQLLYDDIEMELGFHDELSRLICLFYLYNLAVAMCANMG
jgi:hypothetical protein